MEIILGIVILAVLAYMFTRKKDVAEATQEVPYKVEEAAVVTDATDTVVVPVADAVVPVVEEVAPGAEAPAKKARAKKPAAEKKPRAKKAPKA